MTSYTTCRLASFNALLLTNLALTSPISRVLAQTVTPFQMKAHWAKPGLELAEDMVTISADVAGGTRYAIEGINLTMEGQVNTKRRPVVAANDSGQPVVTLATPSPLELHLGDLELRYEGDDEILTWVDTSIERTLLRPTLCAQLMAPLTNLPLNCLPDAVPLHLTDEPHHGATPADGLALTDAAVSLDPHVELLTLGMRCAAHSTRPQPPPNLLPDHSTANAVVALSETGLNRTIGWLCAQGLATGTTPQPDGSVSWRWTHVAASFTDHAIHLTGQLWQGESATAVDAELQCSLTSSAQLSVHLTAPKPQPAGTDVLIDACAHLLRRTFFAATRPPEPTHPTATEPDSDQPLLQRFAIPGTDLTIEAPAVGLGLRDGYLVALYAIPSDEQPFSLTLEEKKPKPTIIQPDMPLQEAPGATVTTQLAATLAGSPEPPYDYAWRADQELHPRPNHGPTMIVTKTPPPTTATGEPQKLATVNLKVIDMLGQVGEAEVDAMYYPAAAQHQEKGQDGKQGTTAELGGAGLIASAAQFYQKWKDRQKKMPALLRVIGLPVAAILIAILLFIAVPVIAKPGNIAKGRQEPILTTTDQTTAAPPSSAPAMPPPRGGTSRRHHHQEESTSHHRHGQRRSCSHHLHQHRRDL